MDVLGDLVARSRRSDAPALRVPARERSYSWHDFCSSSYRAGNILRFLGLREGALVAVPADPVPESILAFVGAAQIGAVTRFGLPTDSARGRDEDGDVTPRVVLAPVERESDFDLSPATKLAVFGGPPERPETTHWEQELWSENPAVHPTAVSPDDPVLVDGRGEAPTVR
ncbi:MAG: AMP-binding protein, partial [Halobacteriota archaeon]